MSVSRPRSAAFVTGNAAPLIAERAATSGHVATVSGGERAGERRYSFERQAREPYERQEL